MKKFYLLLIALLTTVACQKHINFETHSNSVKQDYQNHRIPIKQAIRNLHETAGHLYGNTKVTSQSETDIIVIRYQDIFQNQTKGGATLDIDSIFYVINFENNSGFAILAADDRFPEVLAITEQGSYYPFGLDGNESNNISQTSDNIYIGPPVTIDHILEKFVDYTISDIYDRPNDDNSDVLDPIGGGSHHYIYGAMQIPEMLQTKWNQTEPFNNLMPLINNNTEIAPTGCGVTALAQVLTYKKNISLDEIFNISEYNWTDLEQEYITTNSHIAEPISLIHYHLYIGTESEVDFADSGETYTAPKNIAAYLREIGYSTAAKYNGYNLPIILNQLQYNKPIIISAVTSEQKTSGYITFSGHTWVIDGVDRYISSYKKGVYTTLLHCNWGWGGTYNGYYVSDMFDTDNGLIYEEPSRQSEEDNNNYRMFYRIVTY